MNAAPIPARTALQALSDSLHADAMRSANAMLRRDRKPTARTRAGERQMPLGLVGRPMPVTPEPLP